MKKLINGKEVLVDVGGKAAPPMPPGMIAVLRDGEWVVRSATPWEEHELEEITLADVATMVGQLTVIYPMRFRGFTDNQLKSTALAWHEKVKGMDRELVAKAFNQCTSVMSTPPTPADLLKTITSIRNGAP